MTAIRVRCTVVQSPMNDADFNDDSENGYLDLLPWADPYIAMLAEKLQAEHRRESLLENTPTCRHNAYDDRFVTCGEDRPPLSDPQDDVIPSWRWDESRRFDATNGERRFSRLSS